jgi:hypothetical protein
VRESTTLAVLPLALVAVTVTAGHVEDGTLPEASPVRVEESVPHPVPVAMEGPASFSRPEVRRAEPIPTSQDVSGVPLAAIAAYRRAEAVMGAADSSCRLAWQLLAALGRVESDHGRYGGSTLGADGVSRPGVYGVRLDGARGTQAISDSDGGLYDRDRVWDRAVGPMQFIPSTWSAVGVDADGDQRRDPQDIDDAALAAGVYLCAGEGDLADDADLRAAVFRYNHSEAYVDLVLEVMTDYLLNPPSVDRTSHQVHTLFVVDQLDDPRDDENDTGTGPSGTDQQHTPLSGVPDPPGSCAPEAQEPLEPIDPDDQVQPTDGPSPSVEPTPTAEPYPTGTVEPTPTPTLEPTGTVEPTGTFGPTGTLEPTADPTGTAEPTASGDPTEPTESPEPTAPVATVEPPETRSPPFTCGEGAPR